MTTANEIRPEISHPPLAADSLLQGRYQIVRQLGRGGMGAVYEANDLRLGITVALKETFSTEAATRKQFEHEARLLAGMQHPALPRVSDHFVEGSRAFLVMQFIGGVDLARIISQQPGPFPRDQVIAWADQLLDALIYLHSRDRQVIHRDIKPHNLKLTATGQIALLDFGLAKAQPADTSVTASRAFFGYTRHYAPLEQIQDQRTDPRSDIYALGATLYHLLTGIKPPDALVRATAVLNGEPDPLQPAQEIHAAVGQQLSAILNKAMAQQSEERYASAADFREALRGLGRTRLAASTPVVASANGKRTGKTTADNPRSTDIQMALVGSARRFGPGVVSTGLVILMGVTAGIFYASPRWLDLIERATAAPTKSNGEVRNTPQQSRKAERDRPTEEVGVTPRTRRLTAGAAKPIDEKREVKAPKSQADGKLPSQRATKSVPTNRRLISAPSIRLPNPDIDENPPAATVDSGIHGYRSMNDAPKFFRAADGTHIIKFSDGTTRYVRPGERAGQQ